MIHYSLLLPQRGAAEAIRQFLPLWCETLDKLSSPYEIVVADDASFAPDRKVLAQLLDEFPSLRVVALDRPVGVAATMQAAIAHSRGEILIRWEASLRYPPGQLPNMLRRLVRADLVCGRSPRHGFDKWWAKTRMLSRRLLLGSQQHDPDCPCWVAYRETVAGLQLTRGQQHLLPWLVALRGFRITNGFLPVDPYSDAPDWETRDRLQLFDLLAMYWQQRRSQSIAPIEMVAASKRGQSGRILRADGPHDVRHAHHPDAQWSPDEEPPRPGLGPR